MDTERTETVMPEKEEESFETAGRVEQKGRTEQIFDHLIDSIENGQSVPLAVGKVLVNKDEMLLWIRELENILLNEQRMYREVNDKRGKIINDAKKEAEDIIYEAEQTASRIRVSKRMPSVAAGMRLERLNETDKEAVRTAEDIYAASLIYTDEMLTEVNDLIADAYNIIQSQYKNVVHSLEEKANLIQQNKNELMSSLKDLSKEERYEQILDLSQLLSFELYNERSKLKEAEKAGDKINNEKQE